MSIFLNTKLRTKLFAYTFTHPGEQWYVREIASLINDDPGNISRELRKLEEEGIFLSIMKGRIKFYSLNKKYPLFKELKKIIFKTIGVEGTLKDLILKYAGISLAFIYGSYAKNKEKKPSDIDLVVVGKYHQEKFIREIRKLEAQLNREINFTVYTNEEFAEEKKKEGGFLNLILKEKIILLKGTLRV